MKQMNLKQCPQESGMLQKTNFINLLLKLHNRSIIYAKSQNEGTGFHKETTIDEAAENLL